MKLTDQQTGRDKVERDTNWAPWLIGGVVAVAFVCCLGALSGAYWFLQTRTEAEEQPSLQIPTRSGGETETRPTEAAALAPTATLSEPLPTEVDVTATAMHLASAPAIDGDLSEWTNVPTTESRYRVYNVDGWDGTEDLAATWRLGWDGDNLYAAVRVQDDRHVQTQTGSFTYRGDSLEMQIDTDRQADFNTRVVSPDDFQLALSPGNFADLAPEAYRFRGTADGTMTDAPGHTIRVAARRTAEGYTLEAAIPWSDLAVSPEAGDVLGIALNANDNDTPGTAVQEVMLSHVSTRTFRNPTTWGTLALGG